MSNGKVETEEIIKMLNYERHDLVNHLQVLLGYITLQKHDDMKGYILDILTELHIKNEITKLHHPDFTLFLYTFPSRFTNVQFEIDIPTSLQGMNLVNKDEIFVYVQEWLSLIGHHGTVLPSGTQSLILSFLRLEDKLQITVDFHGCLPWDIIEEQVEQLMKQGIKWGSVEEKLKSPEEWVMQFSYPL